MNMSEYLKKKRLLFVLTIIVILFIIVFSVFTFLNKNKESNKVVEQDLKVTYNIASVYPSEIEEAKLNANDSSIIIKNNKKESKKYKIVVKPTDNNTLELNKVYIFINNNLINLTNSTEEIIYQDTIGSLEEKTITFKTWVGIDLLTSDDEDKVLDLKYEVIEV